MPAAVTATVWPASLFAAPPAARATTPLPHKPGTRAGVQTSSSAAADDDDDDDVLSVSDESLSLSSSTRAPPSWPWASEPKPITSPTSSKTKECDAPAATHTALDGKETHAGAQAVLLVERLGLTEAPESRRSVVRFGGAGGLKPRSLTQKATWEFPSCLLEIPQGPLVADVAASAWAWSCRDFPVLPTLLVKPGSYLRNDACIV